LQACGVDCIDTRFDPSNCGGCGKTCHFEHGFSACVDGVCRLASCVASYSDLDNEPANGCECHATSKDDLCGDGIDNNCDGAVDSILTNGIPVSTCKCEPALLGITGGERYEGPPLCSPTTCKLQNDGALLLSYCHTCESPWPWSVCIAANAHDLSGFDGDAGNAGALAVEFCIDGPIPTDVNLWYGQDPWRKRLRLLRREEAQTIPPGPHCYTRYFSPGDACFADFPDLPAKCRNRCGTTDADCTVNFSATPVLLAVEGCAAASSGVIALKSVTYHPSGCLCSDNSSCDATRECRLADLPLPVCPATDPKCGGVCVSATCAGKGSPCQVQVGAQICQSTITCLQGQSVCAVEGCTSGAQP